MRMSAAWQTRFVETRGGDIRAVFRANVRPGRHKVLLAQMVDGKRVVLDRARFIVRR